MIRASNRTPKSLDEISLVLGCSAYWERYYFTDLKNTILTPHSRELVGVSRYYPTLSPQVVVDFEPGPPEKFYVDEKRKFFWERGIVYVPVFLNEYLTQEQFKDRVKQEREHLDRAMVRGREQDHLDAAVTKVDGRTQVHQLENDELAYAEKEAIRRVNEFHPKAKGATRLNALKKAKAEVLNELWRANHAKLGDRVSARELADAAR